MLPSLVTALLLAQAPAAAVPAPQPMPTGDALEKRIVANDARLFWGFFEGCDPDAVSDLIHPDFRMLHDLVGMPLSSGAQMIEQSRRNCADRAPGGKNAGYRNRRLLVPGSRRIQKLGDWGVLEEGHHTFHEWRYIHSWQWMPEEGRFRLLESLSIDHGPAVPYPPQTAARP